MLYNSQPVCTYNVHKAFVCVCVCVLVIKCCSNILCIRTTTGLSLSNDINSIYDSMVQNKRAHRPHALFIGLRMYVSV